MVGTKIAKGTGARRWRWILGGVTATLLVVGGLVVHSAEREAGKKALSGAILEHFVAIPERDFDSILPSTGPTNLKERRRSYFVNPRLDCVVDDSNAYLRIISKIGGGTEITFTSFLTVDKRKVFLLSEIYGGGDCTTYRTTCYTVKDSGWSECPGALPVVHLREFWDPPDGFDRYGLSDGDVEWEYRLPRRGTTILVRPVEKDEGICFGESPALKKFREPSLVGYAKAIRGRDVEALELVWNRTTGTFDRGRILRHLSPCAGITRRDATHVAITNPTVRAIVDDLPALVRAIHLVPVIYDGAALGVQVMALPPGSPAGCLGFRNGDVVRTINGMDVTRPDTRMQDWASLLKAESVRFSILREGRPLVLQVTGTSRL